VGRKKAAKDFLLTWDLPNTRIENVSADAGKRLSQDKNGAVPSKRARWGAPLNRADKELQGIISTKGMGNVRSKERHRFLSSRYLGTRGSLGTP
jgi:hypothetical protein